VSSDDKPSVARIATFASQTNYTSAATLSFHPTWGPTSTLASRPTSMIR
jgi:hypothetical protein